MTAIEILRSLYDVWYDQPHKTEAQFDAMDTACKFLAANKGFTGKCVRTALSRADAERFLRLLRL